MAALSVLLSCCSFGAVGGITAWKEYSAAQKTQSVVGFIHCYRTLLSNKEAFAQADISVVTRAIDAALTNNRDKNIGTSILEALRNAPHAKPDKYAEHWDGAYGFNDGMWWRGVDDEDREAYVQGVFWCAETPAGKAVALSEKSVTAAVQKLNDWYLVSDDEWKDPRSAKRADVAVLSAMRRIGILSKKHVERGTKP
jgi:hypothetical protein